MQQQWSKRGVRGLGQGLIYLEMDCSSVLLTLMLSYGNKYKFEHNFMHS